MQVKILWFQLNFFKLHWAPGVTKWCPIQVFFWPKCCLTSTLKREMVDPTRTEPCLKPFEWKSKERRKTIDNGPIQTDFNNCCRWIDDQRVKIDDETGKRIGNWIAKSSPRNFFVLRGLHSTEVAFLLLTQQPQVRFLTFPPNISS